MPNEEALIVDTLEFTDVTPSRGCISEVAGYDTGKTSDSNLLRGVQ